MLSKGDLHDYYVGYFISCVILFGCIQSTYFFQDDPVNKLKFLVCWCVSIIGSIFSFSVIRSLYLVLDDNSSFYSVGGGFDSVMLVIFLVATIIFSIGFNTFYKSDLKIRFWFITSIQLIFVSGLHLANLLNNNQFGSSSYWWIVGLLIGARLFLNYWHKIGNEKFSLLRNFFGSFFRELGI